MPTIESDFALVIGINDYPDYKRLNGAVADANAVAAWLKDKNGGGGLLDAHCETITSQPDPLEPVQMMIDRKLKALLGTVKDEGRRFYFYFSGHGLAREQFGADLCLPHWSKDYRNNALDSQHYLKTVMESGKFSEVVFWLDCCRLKKPRTTGMPCTFGIPGPDPRYQKKAKTFTAYSSEVYTASYEGVLVDEEEEGKEVYRGHFTSALLRALKGGASTNPAGVSANDLKDYVECITPRIARYKGHHQTPSVENGLSAYVRFGSAAVVDPTKEADVTIKFGPQRKGPFVLLDREANVVRQGAAAGGQWRLPLRGGLYLLTDEGDPRATPFNLRVDATLEFQDDEF